MNSPGLSLQPADAGDAEWVAPWIYDTMGKGIHILGCESLALCLPRIQSMFIIPGHRFSYDTCRILYQESIPMGYIIAYSHQERKKKDFPFLKTLIGMNGWKTTWSYLFHNPGYFFMKESLPGEYYISALGIDRLYRGQGLGTRMLTMVLDQAHRQGYTAASLMVEENNTTALKTYHKIGFQETRKTKLSTITLLHMKKLI